ncbi:hypothetical protein OR571_21130 [Psychrobacillus sp. NEAU-3TGS]|uniref:hypothetical protein n=1 Tax=Psychrobacillus sp. NEAU-3TGS TaxID=2995412 RepID=UPI0024972050|nr:hypothetical protein [Psychrobacillus sp. NEAU-3TGS]MDI2589535.1 hypothetical protein [Psychrobacillus sp. NEAU-3TGS]
MAKRIRRIVNKRVRKGLLKLGLLIVGIYAFLPTYLLESNIQNYENDSEKDFAAYALETTADIFSNTLEQSLIVSYAIESIEEVEGEPLSSVIIAYTAFGLPYAEIIVNENVAYVNKKLLFQK